ncbi:Fe2+-enterobactin ABC transporter substrate-binding protein [Zymobacter sp. IVIA_5232.4 C2]|uniref:Fe2+-enterobactin ABC transporter substrate-binding protein n=1 Tax=Zymobacter sp. IVIA_5232.4 C2 TaxID=3394855 RepID=UPI0039C3FE63
MTRPPCSGFSARRLLHTAGRLMGPLLMMLCIAPAHATEGWPRHIQDDGDGVTLSAPPTRIVSTSVTLTGSLLAIDAPVIASGATAPRSRIADDQGFLLQWSDQAKQRHLQRLYIGTPDLEAIAMQAPDLIVVSASGADSALKLKSQLSQIAPTLVINYDHAAWQDITRLLGRATGHDADADARIAEFDAALKKTRAHLQLPPQPVSAFTWPQGQQNSANLWTNESAQGRLLEALGMTLAKVPPELADFHQMGKRHDILPVGGERLADALTGKTWLIFAANDDTAQVVRQHPFLKNTLAVQQGRVFALGTDTFRLDYYSAMRLLERLSTLFGSPASASS